MMFILKLWAISLVLCLGAQAFQWLLFWLLKIKVEKAAISFGKPLAKFRAGAVVIEIGWLPLGAYLKYDIDAFEASSWVGRTLIILFLPLVLVLVGCVLLGPGSGIHHYVSGFSEVFTGALHPRTIAVDLIGKLEAVSRVSVPTWWGITAAKAAVFHSLPFGSLSGGVYLRHLAVRLAGQRSADLYDARPTRWFAVIDALGNIALLLTLGSWYLALVVYAWRSSMVGG